MADNLSPLVNLDLINKIYKTINAQIAERVYDPQHNPGVALGGESSRYSNAYLQALNVQGDATISGNISTGTLNSLILTKESAGFTISGGTTAKTLTVADTATITKSLEVAAATSIKSNLTVSAATNIVKGLTVGTANTGAVTIQSEGTSSTTIVGPSGGTANLIKGYYKDSAITENSTTPTEDKLLKIKKVGANTFLAGPATGTDQKVPEYRTIQASDLPKAGANVSGIVTIEAQTFEGAKTFNKPIIGNINGNAGTATKLKTARSFKIADADSTNISAAGADFDGTEAVTLKLPATIKATFSGDLTGNVTGNVSGNAGTASQVKTTKTDANAGHYISFVDGNNATAETVYTNSNLTYNPSTGTLSATSFNGPAAKVAHSLSIQDGAKSPAIAINSWNGSDDKTLTIKGTSPITATATDDMIVIAHGDSEVAAGTYRSVTVDVKGHVTAGTSPTTLDGYGITDAKIEGGKITLGSNIITPLTADSSLAASKVSGTLAADNIPKLDASKIDSGTIAVERLPATALERCVVVASDTARFALTTASVQVGDTVKVTDTKKMYMVVDSSNLSTDAGYEEYFTSTDWSTVTNKPSSYTPSSHPHGNITNAGAIGTAADKLVTTTKDGVLTAATTLAATSLAAGSTPTVSLSGGTLTFGIPKGDKGDTGSQGPVGPNFDLAAGSGVQYLIGASSQNGNISTARTSSAYFDGSSITASGFYVSSLRSLKENIEPTKVRAVSLINSQEIVDFNYKADEDKTRKVGLIADDSDPLFLDKRGETVDLYNTCGILMKAVQELSKKIEELEQKLS